MYYLLIWGLIVLGEVHSLSEKLMSQMLHNKEFTTVKANRDKNNINNKKNTLGAVWRAVQSVRRRS